MSTKSKFKVWLAGLALAGAMLPDLAEARGGRGGGGGGGARAGGGGARASASRGTTRTSVHGGGRAANTSRPDVNRGDANRANTNRGDANRANANRTDVNRGANTNRNVNANQNVNVNRNVNVHNDIDYDHHYHGGYYGDHDHDGAWFAAGVMTAVVVGSVVRSLPPSCETVVLGGVTYQNCGGTWYQPQYSGSSVTYVVVNQP